MKKWTSLMMMLTLVSFVAMGCGGDEKKDADKPATDTSQVDENPTPTPPVTPTSQVAKKYAGKVICGDCGHEVDKDKAAEHKCHEGHAACEECGFPKGTALCCTGLKVEDAKGEKFCGDCGQVAGSDDCCSLEGTKCEKCGFHEGSALCCKLSAKE